MKSLSVISILLLFAFIEPVKAQLTFYHEGWTNFNKNGKKEVFEDSPHPVEERIANLLSQMTPLLLKPGGFLLPDAGE
ncbi:MAG TPA: hypothetical protein VKB95_13225 [Chitinophagaceae bacterium]|nr:hypothetical protein [Chitinophagaceae bacterium]